MFFVRKKVFKCSSQGKDEKIKKKLIVETTITIAQHIYSLRELYTSFYAIFKTHFLNFMFLNVFCKEKGF